MNKNVKKKKKLQNNFIITYVNKAPNNNALIYKSYYDQLINTSLTLNNNFVLTNSSNVNKNKQIHAFYKLLKLPHNNFNYPNLVLIPKLHKKPVKFRTVIK